MSAIVMDGRETAKTMKEYAKFRVNQLRNKITPKLAVIRVGEDPASVVYVRQKEKACEDTGIQSETIRIPETATEDEIINVIEQLNIDSSIHGILVQLPLPNHIDEQHIISSIDPTKDVDGFTDLSVSSLFRGETGEGYKPCTPLGIYAMLQSYDIEIEGKHVVVIGRSNIVGKPMAMLMLNKNATVTVCHSRTKNLADITRTADILIVAVGKPGFVTDDMVKRGCVVVDVGINRIVGEDGKTHLVGDVDFNSVKEKVRYISPVPGGVGPLTVASLMLNTVEAAERQYDQRGVIP